MTLTTLVYLKKKMFTLVLRYVDKLSHMVTTLTNINLKAIHMYLVLKMFRFVMNTVYINI